jgi:sulfopyruvate decarboxylase subunit beta
MFNQVDMMRIVEKYRGNAIVILVYRASKGWKEVTSRPELDIPVGGAMGKASSFALGLALAQPDKKVILFDGDGSLEMNLGALITIAEKQPKNLLHFVVQNGIYASTGGQPIVGQDVVSFAEMARAAGYAAAYDFDDLEEFENSAQEIMSEDGPVLICMRTIPEIRLPEERVAERAAAGNRGPAHAYESLKKELERVS